MTINECMCVISAWYKVGATYSSTNNFKSAYLLKIKELSDTAITTSLCSDNNFIYIDKKILTMKIIEIYKDDCEFTKGEKTANNDLYNITDIWRQEYYKGKIY